MNVNPNSLQSVGFFRKINTPSRFRGINIAAATIPNPSIPTAKRVSSASISSEAKAMFARSKEENNKATSTSVTNIGESVCLTHTLEIIYENDETRIFESFFPNRGLGISQRNWNSRISFTDATQQYAVMRQELKAGFDGDELKIRLEQLAESYQNALRQLSITVYATIRTFAFYDGQEGVESTIEAFFGVRPSLSDNFSSDSIANIFRDFVMKMGQQAREFILEDGSTERFIHHLINSTNAVMKVAERMSI